MSRMTEKEIESTLARQYDAGVSDERDRIVKLVEGCVVVATRKIAEAPHEKDTRMGRIMRESLARLQKLLSNIQGARDE